VVVDGLGELFVVQLRNRVKQLEKLAYEFRVVKVSTWISAQQGSGDVCGGW
jgi:hypothetical protein